MAVLPALRLVLEPEFPELLPVLPDDVLLRTAELLVPDFADVVDEEGDEDVDDEEDLLDVFAVVEVLGTCDGSSSP